MSTQGQSVDAPLDGVVLDPVTPGSPWPVETRWRAALRVQGEYRAPEWVITRVKAVPLSSRSERALLAAVAGDDGRAVLDAASTPGEHHVAAAVIASLRLAGEYPERAIRFLDWLRASPDDPGRLRFLRRYLPGLEVLVEPAPGIPLALPLDRTALTLLQAELLRSSGSQVAAEAILAELPSRPSVTIALAATRLALGNVSGAREIAVGRPVFDGVTAAVAVVGAQAEAAAGEHAKALEVVTRVLDVRNGPRPVTARALDVRAASLRALGRDVEADLAEIEMGASRSETGRPTTRSDAAESAVGEGRPTPPPGPLFGRSLTDALDDAWARVRRQPRYGSSDEPFGADEVGRVVDDAVALIEREQYDSAETLLLSVMDRVEDQVDAGGPMIDDFFVLLAGAFHKRDMVPEEVATLERLRAAHVRAGSVPSDEIVEHLARVRASLDALT
jgi:hypothetical protein